MPRGHTVKKVNHQTGKTNAKKDRQLDALSPGHRVSRRGKKYYEGRKNRSDLFGRI